MRAYLCAAAIALAAGSASADYIARQGADYVRFTEAPCALDVENKALQFEAFAEVGGKQFKACWVPVSLQHIRLVYEDGDVGLVNIRDLMPAPEA